MSGSDWTVLLAAVLAIVAVNWWFFVAGRAPVAAAAAAGAAPAEVLIVVDGGYSPSQVEAKRGQRLRLVFDRRDRSACSEELVIPSLGIRQYLPFGERTVIEVTPTEAGRVPFTCGMSMLRGSLIINE